MTRPQGVTRPGIDETRHQGLTEPGQIGRVDRGWSGQRVDKYSDKLERVDRGWSEGGQIFKCAPWREESVCAAMLLMLGNGPSNGTGRAPTGLPEHTIPCREESSFVGVAAGSPHHGNCQKVIRIAFKWAPARSMGVDRHPSCSARAGVHDSREPADSRF